MPAETTDAQIGYAAKEVKKLYKQIYIVQLHSTLSLSAKEPLCHEELTFFVTSPLKKKGRCGSHEAMALPKVPFDFVSISSRFIESRRTERDVEQ